MDTPIDKSTLTAIRKALSVLDEVAPLLDLAEQAGLDVADERARHSHYTEIASKLIATYEPILNKVKRVDG